MIGNFYIFRQLFKKATKYGRPKWVILPYFIFLIYILMEVKCGISVMLWMHYVLTPLSRQNRMKLEDMIASIIIKTEGSSIDKKSRIIQSLAKKKISQ